MEARLFQEHFDLENEHWWFKAKRKIVISLLKQSLSTKKNPKLFDAGCGAGLMLSELKKIGPTKAMDYSSEAISFSLKRFEGEIKQGEFPHNIPFERNQFDGIVCLDVIEHIDDDLQSVRKLSELLVPGGVMVLTVPALMSLWSKWDDVNHHKRRYLKSELEALFHQSNLSIQKISYYNSLLFLPVFLIRKINNLLQRESEKSDTELPSPFVNSVLERIFSLEEKLLRYINFPIGVSLIAVVKKNS